MMVRIMREKLSKNMRLLKLYLGLFLVTTVWLLFLMSIKEHIYKPSSPVRLSLSRHLPLAYWQHRTGNPEKYGTSMCGHVPRPHELKLTDQYWQKVLMSEGNTHVYSAYWDPRFDDPVVRVLAYSDTYRLPILHCQFWYLNEKSAHSVRAEAMHIGEGRGSDGFGPYIINCKAKEGPAPIALSLATSPCGQASNLLNVQGTRDIQFKLNSPPFRGSAAVCVKLATLSWDDPNLMVEWLEMLHSFDVQKVFFYVQHASPAVLRVVDRYMAKEFVDITYIPESHADEDIRSEFLVYNDCLYRSIGWFEWIVPLNIEDMIVPIGDDSWVDMTSHAIQSSSGSIDGLSLDAHWFPEEAQRDLPLGLNASQTRMLAHVWRAKQVPLEAQFWRTISNVNTTVAVLKREPVKCGADASSCNIMPVPHTTAKLHRYGRCVKLQRKTCRLLANDTERDTSMESVKKAVLKGVNKQLRILKLTEL